jgi:HEAT repeat protein
MTLSCRASCEAARGARDAARGAACALATVLLLGAGAGLAQDPVDDITARVVQSDARKLLADPDPVVRGEAALAVATAKDPADYDSILAVARDKEPEARLRGLVALGLQGAPGAEQVLVGHLGEAEARESDAAIAAACALGLLPDDAATLISKTLAAFLRGSQRRQRDALLALLTALATRDCKDQHQPLIHLLEDAAIRDVVVRAAVLEALARTSPGIPERLQKQVLERGEPSERIAVLRPLDAAKGLPETILAVVVRLATSDGVAAVRATALAALTSARHLPALDLAARALKSQRPEEVEQGVRTALALGGGSMRGALERHVLATADHGLQAAMLRGFVGSISPEFAETCRRIGADRKKPLPLRAEAALLLGRHGDERAVPILRDAFLDAEDPDLLLALASAVLKLEKEPPDLQRLHRGTQSQDLWSEPARLCALVHAGHPAAVRLLLEGLRAPATVPAQRAALLRVFRLATRPIAGLPGDLAPVVARLFRP